jgi:uncharacterized protein YndB with AHSA1/START domain
MTLKIDITIHAPIEQVYSAFTNSTTLREWLCDFATTDPKIGGRIYMWWTSGFYTSGEFTRLVENHTVEFTWNGRGEPGPTCVQVAMSENGGAVALSLAHTELGEGPEWDDYRKEFQVEWERSLRNLASVLETGPDLRITRRPMLGIYLSDFNPEIAEKLHIPVKEGVRIDGTLDGLGAQKAGLLPNDVIVSMDGHPVGGFNGIAPIVQKHEAGDTLSVDFYRGQEKHSVQMVLGQRPIPEIPWDPDRLVEAIIARNSEASSALGDVFKGVTEDQAEHRPAEGEWNAKEILAHLILGEQGLCNFTSSIMMKGEQWADDGGNNHAQVKAVVSAYPTISALLDELKRSEQVTLSMLRNCGPDFIARKSSYWRAAFNHLQGPVHTLQHIEQIKAACNS